MKNHTWIAWLTVAALIIFQSPVVEAARTAVQSVSGYFTTSSQDATSVYYTGGKVGIGSSTPMAILSVSATTTSSYTSIFRVATSTAANTLAALLVGANGNINIGTSTPNATTSPYIGLRLTGPFVSENGLIANYVSSTTPTEAAYAAIQLVDWSKGNLRRLIATTTVNLVINATSSNPIDGAQLTLQVCQDNAGAHTVNFITPGQLRWPGATSTISTVANACTFVPFIYENTYKMYFQVGTTSIVKNI